MNSFFALFYSLSFFIILFLLTLYLIKQIFNTQLLEKNIKSLQNKIKLDEVCYEDFYRLGQFYLQKKFYNKAILTFRKALKIWNINDKIGIASLSNTIGFTYFKLKKYRFAIYYYKIALKIIPDYILALKNLAYLYESTGLLSEAKDQYDTSLLLDPKNEFFINRLKLIERQLIFQTSQEE